MYAEYVNRMYIFVTDVGMQYCYVLFYFTLLAWEVKESISELREPEIPCSC